MGSSNVGGEINPLAPPLGPSLGTFPRVLQFWELLDYDQQATLYRKMGGVSVFCRWLGSGESTMSGAHPGCGLSLETDR